ACEKIVKETSYEVKSSLYHGAMDLYRGNLLPRFDHMQWQMPRSAYYENLYLRLAKGHIAYKFETHDYAAAQKTAVEALAREPYDTDLMVALTISMCEQGNRSLAYSYFCKIKPQLTEEQIEILMRHCKKTK
ncbi:MAG: bacterial transcriptional activator domain-containing protein, partial [Enterocloster sp.]